MHGCIRSKCLAQGHSDSRWLLYLLCIVIPDKRRGDLAQVIRSDERNVQECFKDMKRAAVSVFVVYFHTTLRFSYVCLLEASLVSTSISKPQ